MVLSVLIIYDNYFHKYPWRTLHDFDFTHAIYTTLIVQLFANMALYSQTILVGRDESFQVQSAIYCIAVHLLQPMVGLRVITWPYKMASKKFVVVDFGLNF